MSDKLLSLIFYRAVCVWLSYTHVPLMSHSHDVFFGYLPGPSSTVPCKPVKIVLPLHFAWEDGRQQDNTKIKPYNLRSAICILYRCKLWSLRLAVRCHNLEVAKVSLRLETNEVSFNEGIPRSSKHCKPTSRIYYNIPFPILHGVIERLHFQHVRHNSKFANKICNVNAPHQFWSSVILNRHDFQLKI